MTIKNNWKSTKFFISVLFSIFLFVLTYYGKLDAGGFTTGMGIILALYQGSDIAEKKLK